MLVRTYQVADLVWPEALPDPAVRSRVIQCGETLYNELFGPLVELLNENVAPGTWTSAADSSIGASITPFHLNFSLIVRATPEAHSQIEPQLQLLRRLPAVKNRKG